MPTVLQGEQLSPTFEKYSTIGGIAGSARLVNTGEATNVLPLAVVLQTAAGVSYTASGGGGGGGGEVTIGDPSTPTNQAAVLAPGGSGAFALSVQGVPSGTALPVSGTFYQTTQPISAASLPLPSGASTAAKQPALGTAGTASADVLSVQGIASMTALKTDGSAVTQPVSAASLPLPTGASTAAKQPAIGTAGAASADVLSVQGLTSMTPLKTDGSGVTQPVSIAASVAVTGTFYQATQPISAASLPLPTGASTAAKQPAIGTAGTPSADVLTVQGAASMTALSTTPQVGGSAVSVTNPMPTIGENIAATSGAISANGTGVSCTIPSGCGEVLFSITGSWVGTLTYQASPDNVNWSNIFCSPISSGGALATTTANIQSVALILPYQFFRIQATAWTSGSASISLQPLAYAGITQICYSGRPAYINSLSADGNAVQNSLWGTSQNVIYNGSTWDRQYSDATGKSRVSLYGTNSVAGDTALSVNASGYANVVAGGKTAKIAVTPTVTSGSAYTTGNVVGGKMTFSSALLTAGSGVLESIAIRCKSVQTAIFTLFLFDSNPTNSTWTDKTAPAINAADIPFLVGAYQLASFSSGLGTHTIYGLNGISQALAAGATTLYGILTVTGTPTFASTSDISCVLGILQD